MKRVWVVVLALLMAAMLFGCGNEKTVYEVKRNDITFRVDTEQKTVSDGTYVYSYSFSGDASSYKVTVRYPNRSSYWFSKRGNSGYGGWSDDYVETAYVSGGVLVDIIEETAREPVNIGKIFGGILVIAIGIFNAAAPETAWYLERGWWYKNAAPSDMALAFTRGSGIVAIIAGIILLLA